MNRECEKLDALLNAELAADDVLRFEAHINDCEACRDVIEQQRWIDGLLRSGERLELEPAPAGMSSVVRPSRVRRRTARFAACGLAAAAVLLIAIGWIALLNRQARHLAEGTIAQPVIAETHTSPSPSLKGRETLEPTRAVFDGGADVFVAAVESRHPNVTIVRLYPTYKPSLTPNSSGESTDADGFNGG